MITLPLLEELVLDHAHIYRTAGAGACIRDRNPGYVHVLLLDLEQEVQGQQGARVVVP